jgi:hypothetical protein
MTVVILQHTLPRLQRQPQAAATTHGARLFRLLLPPPPFSPPPAPSPQRCPSHLAQTSVTGAPPRMCSSGTIHDDTPLLQRLHAEAASQLGYGLRPAAALVRDRPLPSHVVRRCSSRRPPQPCCHSLTCLADQAHSLLPSAFADAEACNRCITLGAGSSVTPIDMPGGGRMLQAKDALGRQVKMTVPQGGSSAQLDMWALMMDKVLQPRRQLTTQPESHFEQLLLYIHSLSLTPLS